MVRESSNISLRSATQSDALAWLSMRCVLWPDDVNEHALEVARYFSSQRTFPNEVLLAVSDSGEIVGFAEVSIRPFAEGSYDGPVAYLEGWFVKEHERGRGIGAALVLAAEEWGRRQGCIALASDAEIENEISTAAHKALGFAEVARLVCFRKDL